MGATFNAKQGHPSSGLAVPALTAVAGYGATSDGVSDAGEPGTAGGAGAAALAPTPGGLMPGGGAVDMGLADSNSAPGGTTCSWFSTLEIPGSIRAICSATFRSSSVATRPCSTNTVPCSVPARDTCIGGPTVWIADLFS